MIKLINYDLKDKRDSLIVVTLITVILNIVYTIARGKELAMVAVGIGKTYYRCKDLGLIYFDYFYFINLMCGICLITGIIAISGRGFKKDIAVKIARGYTRSQIYTSYSVVFALFLALVAGIYCFTTLILGHYILKYKSLLSTLEVIFYYLNYVLGFFTVSLIIVMLCMYFNKKIVGGILAVLVISIVWFNNFDSYYDFEMIHYFTFDFFADAFDYSGLSITGGINSCEYDSFYQPVMDISLLIRNIIIVLITLVSGNVLVKKVDFR